MSTKIETGPAVEPAVEEAVIVLYNNHTKNLGLQYRPGMTLPSVIELLALAIAHATSALPTAVEPEQPSRVVRLQ